MDLGREVGTWLSLDHLGTPRRISPPSSERDPGPGQARPFPEQPGCLHLGNWTIVQVTTNKGEEWRKLHIHYNDSKEDLAIRRVRGDSQQGRALTHRCRGTTKAGG